MPTRVVIFGLDGATYSVLDDLAGKGLLPNYARFKREGVHGNLLSTIPPLTPPAWTSLVTGRSPAAHGIFNFLQFESESSPYLRIISSREIKCETLWSIVSRAGARAAALNFVAHSPPPRINGYVIPGWLPFRWVKKHSHPPDLIDRLRAHIPGFDVETMAMNFQEEEKAVAGSELQDYEPWIDLHIRREQQWFACMKHILQSGDCDLVAIVFDGVDKLQHLVWQFLDPACMPENPSPRFLRTRRRCWDYFAQLDDFLGQTIQLVGDSALILIVSDHGFTGTSEIVYINTWLEQQGYLAWKDGVSVETNGSQELGAAHPYHLTHIDLSKTRAYATSASSNGLHIPIAGVRGPHGLRPTEYESFRNELRDALLTRCVDPETGEPLVKNVWTREEIFNGPNINSAPDLTLALRDHGFFSVLRSDCVLKPRVAVMGCHHPEGVFLARGPGIRSGVQIAPLQMIDIAPTVLYALNVPIPSDLEGKIATEIFTAQRLSADPPASRADAMPTQTPDALPPNLPESEDDAQVLLRLKALGYIE